MITRCMACGFGALLFMAPGHNTYAADTLLAGTTPAVSLQRLHTQREDPESRLLEALSLLKSQGIDASMREVESLVTDYPHFRLARLVYADLLLARAGRVRDIGEPGLLNAQGHEAVLQGLVHEARQRLRANLDAPHVGKIPLELLQLGTKTNRAVLVEKARNRLYVFIRGENGRPPRLLEDYYVSYGRGEGDKQVRGDLRTPEGVYFVQSHIPDEKLQEKYGRGAYPINYPNPLDRKLGKTGDGIWLHGVERSIYSRPPLASEGCVVLANADLLDIGKLLKPGHTPVVIAKRLRWVDTQTWQQAHEQALAAVAAWKQDWGSLDLDRYLAHYAQDFWAKGHDLARWSKRKAGVFSRKTYQKIRIADLNILRYPDDAGDGRDILVASFHQRFRSNNYDSDGRKQLFWVKQDGAWKVLFEGGG